MCLQPTPMHRTFSLSDADEAPGMEAGPPLSTSLVDTGRFLPHTFHPSLPPLPYLSHSSSPLAPRSQLFHSHPHLFQFLPPSSFGFAPPPSSPSPSMQLCPHGPPPAHLSRERIPLTHPLTPDRCILVPDFSVVLLEILNLWSSFWQPPFCSSATDFCCSVFLDLLEFLPCLLLLLIDLLLLLLLSFFSFLFLKLFFSSFDLLSPSSSSLSPFSPSPPPPLPLPPPPPLPPSHSHPLKDCKGNYSVVTNFFGVCGYERTFVLNVWYKLNHTPPPPPLSLPAFQVPPTSSVSSTELLYVSI